MIFASNTRYNNFKKEYLRPTASKVSVQGCFINVLGNVENIAKLLRSCASKQGGIKGTEREKGKGKMRSNIKKEENKNSKKEEGER